MLSSAPYISQFVRGYFFLHFIQYSYVSPFCSKPIASCAKIYCYGENILDKCSLGSQCCCCRPLTYLPAIDGRIMLLSVRAYMYLLSRVHSSCNERPTNSSANLIIAYLSLFVIGRFDGFLCRLPFFGQIAAVLDFQFPIHSFPFLSVFAK